MTQKRLKVMLSKLNYDYCKQNNIPFLFSHAISSAWELNALITMGVSSAYIAGELTHQLEFIDTLPIEIRVRVNSAGAPFNYEPLIGGWFRPEDIENLSMIDVCEFQATTIREEQALYRIYAENHAWPGELNMIIKDIPDSTIINRMIPPEFQEHRSNCRQRCQAGGLCRYCYRITKLANPTLLKPLKDKINNEQKIIADGAIS